MGTLAHVHLLSRILDKIKGRKDDDDMMMMMVMVMVMVMVGS